MNSTTFMQKIRASSADKDYQKLADERGIPVEWIRANCKRNFGFWEIVGIGNAVQIKRDVPQKDAKGKPRKYECLPESEPGLFTVAVPQGHYNPYADASYDSPHILTEGHFKAIVGVSHGLRVHSLAGVWNGLKKDKLGYRHLISGIEELIKLGRTEWCIAFDADCATNKAVGKASIELARAIEKAGGNCTIATGQWTVDEGKGMDDFLHENGIEEFRKRLERALTIDEFEYQHADTKSSRTSKLVELTEKIKAHYGERVRYNLLKSIIEIDGQKIDAQDIRFKIAYDLSIDLSSNDAIDVMRFCSIANAYHPVVNYFDNLPAVTAIDPLGRLQSLWGEILGLKPGLACTQITKTLVGAVARAYNPGCPMRTVTVLYGGQNIGKSTFIRELLGEDCYSDSYEGTSEKDDLLKLHKAFIHEIAEIDAIYRKTDSSKLKHIISARQDEIREPYGRETMTRERRCVLMGTTNSQDFLRDCTGSTRFWVIPVYERVNIPKLIASRDEIWSLAKALYKADMRWELTPQEDLEREKINSAFTPIDLIDETVAQFCQWDGNEHGLKDFVQASEVIQYCFPGKSPNEVGSTDTRRVYGALTKLGYETGTKRINGKTMRAWVLKNVTPVTPKTDECYTGVTPAVQGFECGVTPVTALSQTFDRNNNFDASVSSTDEKTVDFTKLEKTGVTGVTSAETLTQSTSHLCNSTHTVGVTLLQNNEQLAIDAVLSGCLSTDSLPVPDVKAGDVVELLCEHSFASAGTMLEVVKIDGHRVECLRYDRKKNNPNSQKIIHTLVSNVKPKGN